MAHENPFTTLELGSFNQKPIGYQPLNDVNFANSGSASSGSNDSFSLPRNPTPITGGGSFSTLGAQIGSNATNTLLGAGLGGGVGLVLDGALMWWQKQEADKQAKAQLNEARRLNAIEQRNKDRNYLLNKDQFDLSKENSLFNRHSNLRAERIAKLGRIKQGLVDSLKLKSSIQDRFAQKGYV